MSSTESHLKRLLDESLNILETLDSNDVNIRRRRTRYEYEFDNSIQEKVDYVLDKLNCLVHKFKKDSILSTNIIQAY